MKASHKRKLAAAILAAEASLAASLALAPSSYSVWDIAIERGGEVIWRDTRRHNLVTTGAATYQGANNWLGRIMGMGPSVMGAWSRQSGAFTVGATSISGLAGLPTASLALQGWTVVIFGNTNNILTWGVVGTNTATSITYDQVYNPTSSSGAADTTPTGTTFYVMFLPGGMPAPWLAMTANAITPAITDTSLPGELTSSVGLARAVGSWSQTAGATTFALTKTFTASGSGATPTVAAVFGAANPTAGGVMPFEDAISSPPPLLSGDTITLTETVTV